MAAGSSLGETDVSSTKGYGLIPYSHDSGGRSPAAGHQESHALSPDVLHLARLHEIGTKSVQDGNLVELLREVLEINIDVTTSDFGDVQLLDTETERLRVVTQRGLPESFVKYFDGIPVNQEACGSALTSRHRIVVEDVRLCPLFTEPARRTLLEAEAVACQLTPLFSRGGDPLGVISTHFRHPHEPSPAQLQLVDLFARHAADFIEYSRSREQMQALCAREQAARERAEAANRATDQFLATLAHELRQPLSAAFPAIEVQRRSLSPERRERAGEVIQQQLRHMARLVEDLSDASAISRGAIELSRVRLDLRSVVQHAIDMTAPLFQGKNQETTIALGTEPVWVFADETRLTQVFSNLLRNASAYTPEAGDVEMKIEQEDGQVSFMLRDNGIGVPPDALGRIFELFERGSQSNDLPGVGIGLAVVRQIVELHGGTVQVHSDGLGHGTQFIVALASADADQPRAASSSS
jgi:signal transduction histidine kinase